MNIFGLIFILSDLGVSPIINFSDSKPVQYFLQQDLF